MTDEKTRLERLRRMQILDTQPDPLFDGIVSRALAAVEGASISAVSLVDANRQWFKAIAGLDVRQTPRDVAFCAHTIQRASSLIVEDAEDDPRFAANPLVTGTPGIRFYAGIPLVDGVGALCVIGTKPRRMKEAELVKLKGLAVEVNTHLMLHATLTNLKRGPTVLR